MTELYSTTTQRKTNYFDVKEHESCCYNDGAWYTCTVDYDHNEEAGEAGVLEKYGPGARIRYPESAKKPPRQTSHNSNFLLQ